MEEYSDETLIQQALDGDKTAFSVLVDRYKEAVHALAYRKLGNFHEAEDVVQETFLRAHQKLPTLKNRGKFAGWLYAIATNCCRMSLRSRERRDAESTSFDELRPEQISQISLAQRVGEPRSQLLDEAIEALPESGRTPLKLYYMEGMSCSEIGRMVGISANAVRDRLYRARKRLRKEMMEMTEKPAKARFEWIGLELCVAGGPNSTRYFHAMGSDPQGELISFGDARWVIDQFTELTKTRPPTVKGVGVCLNYEPTLHPDSLALWERCIQLDKENEEDPEESYSVLSTNGCGIARADNYRHTLERLRELGTRAISLPLHGLEEHHDWLAHRKGAFRDVFLSAERAAEAGMGVHFNVWVDRQNIPHLSQVTDIIGGLRDRVQSEVTQSITLPRFVVTGKDEVRFYESELRPRLSDLEALPSAMAPVEPPYDRYAESAWVERILANPTEQSFMTEGFDNVSDDEGCYILIIDELLDVYREPYNFDWPPAKIGNLKTDGLPVILDRLEAHQTPQLPDLVTLAEKYGNRDSMLIHRNAFSVRSKWLDMYWRSAR
jgi:RNA polymerase sigma factor (sigma-70 family)